MQSEDGAIDLERVAQALKIGPRSRQRRLSGENTSFRALSNSVRIQRAQELLRLGQESITAIACRLGYSSSNNFSRAFEDHVGLAPSEYQLISSSTWATCG